MPSICGFTVTASAATVLPVPETVTVIVRLDTTAVESLETVEADE